MTTETTERKSKEAELARDQVHVEKTIRILKRESWALAAGFVGVMLILGGTVWGSYRTSQREARVFASVSATAFGQGFCDRALRLAVAGLPPDEGAFPHVVSFATVAGPAVVLWRPRMTVIFDWR